MKNYLLSPRIALTSLLFALAACSNVSGTLAAAADAPGAPAKANDPPRSVDAKAWCAKLQPAVQSKVKIPLSLFKADDSRTDDAYADDPTYVSCIFDSNGKRVTVILRAGNESMERDRSNGLTPVAGYGDQAFYSGEKGGQLRWVDVVRGKDSCEALLGLEASDLASGDFSKAGGEICIAALAAR
ncbi:MAG TPA: hypothetical protein VJ727_09120 [Rhodanobacteraceae bacterium]|nr:hypothetical protein [Rhodanobacteraceae bacterium]